MASNNFTDLLYQLFEKNNLIKYTEQKYAKNFMLLYDKLITDNKKFNLTAITEESDVIIKHFIDSLLICDLIPQNAKIIDIGCGAGFPSLPLSIVRKDISILAVDSTAKKVEYVNECTQLLGLNNLIAICNRAEVLGKDTSYRENFDIATARAVAPLPILAELCIPFVKIGGSFIPMKAQSADEEQKKSEQIIKVLGCDEGTSTEYNLYGTEIQQTRKIIIYKKITQTNKKYPRNYSQISKQNKQLNNL